MAYVAQQQLDVYAEAMAHVLRQKMTFDRRHTNSYELKTLSRDSILGSFSARRLRIFFPKDSTKLAEELGKGC